MTKLVSRLGTPQGQAEVVAEIEAIMKILTAKDNMVLFMATNVDKLSAQVSELYKPWWTFFTFDKFDTFDKNKYVIFFFFYTKG